MTTYFLPGKRTSEEGIGRDIEAANRKPGLLKSVTGLVAVLNENRQIVSLNRHFLSSVGISDPMPVFGLRPGESLQCVHTEDNPMGCGTGTYCRTCGISTAIAACIRERRPVERDCALQVQRDGKIIDLFFVVRCAPIEVSGQPYFLISLEDLTKGQKVAELQRVFYQDIDSLVSGLAGLGFENSKSQTLEIGPWTSNAYPLGLKGHVALHDHLSGTKAYSPVLQKISVKAILTGLLASLAGRASEEKKQILLPDPMPSVSFRTDPVLVTRVLRDMVVNAIEAVGPGSKIKVTAKKSGEKLVFSVWNKGAMQKDIPQRVFQRNFSTKPGAGRGLGTFAMKVFGEQLLGGRVSFTTTAASGTRFTLALPLKAAKAARK